MFLNEKKNHINLYLTLPLVITTALWVWAKFAYGEGMQLVETPRYISQILSLWGTILLSINYVMVARFRPLEKLFGGLDKVYKTHGWTSRLAFLFILAHPILLVPQYLIEDLNVLTLFIPGIGSMAKAAGITALYLYTILILLTVTKKLPYHIWKKTHELMGIPFFFAAYHVFNAVSDVARFYPLKVWMAVMISFGLGSYIYKTFLYQYLGPKFEYEVLKHSALGDGIFELILSPTFHKMNFEPGEFAFISVKGEKDIPKEHHPFSIASDPSNNQIRFVYKVFGDYTEKLSKLKKGAKVDLFGPYGEFTSHMLDHFKKQIWIGAGVGVTPFLSMLQHEHRNSDRKNIHFYYCVKNEGELLFQEEIAKALKNSDDKAVYMPYLSDVKGYLNGGVIQENVKDLNEYAILMCGPDRMVKSLKTQFVELGVPEKNIFFEEFNFG